MRLAPATLVLAGALVAFSAPARADTDSDEAHRLADEGAHALEQHHFHTALDRFKRAEVLAPTPAYALGLARSQAAVNRVVAARRTYADIVADAGPVDARILDEAKRELAEVDSRIARVTITVMGPDAPYVVMDDAPLPASALAMKQPIDPGSHVVRATARGFRTAETRFTVLEGGEVAAVLAMAVDPDARREDTGQPRAVLAEPPRVEQAMDAALAPAPVEPVPAVARPAPNPDVFRATAYASFGVGGVGLVTGIAEGLRASNLRSQLLSSCSPSCSVSAVDGVRSAATIADVGYVVAALGVASGITLLVLQPRSQPRTGARVVPYVGVGSVGAVGQF